MLRRLQYALCAKDVRSRDMTDKADVQVITETMAAFIGHSAKNLPDDVLAALRSLRAKEDDPLALEIYDLMFRNLDLARKLDRPICQDTGFLQFWIRCGSGFPFIEDLEEALAKAVAEATERTPLRCNVVETFDEYNTGTNTGTGSPTFWWDIVPGWDGCEIYTYMAGGGSSLPGNAMVLMPGQGYEEVVRFVLDRMTAYGLNAKKALMRPVGSHSENEKAALMEKLLEDGINAIGFGPQGMGGKFSVTGVNVVNTARHPACMGVAVTVGCWSHRRGCVVFDRDLSFEVKTHSAFRAEHLSSSGKAGVQND